MPLFDNQVIYIVDFENKSTSAKFHFSQNINFRLSTLLHGALQF